MIHAGAGGLQTAAVRQRSLVLAALIVLAVAAWAAMLAQHRGMDDHDRMFTMGMGLPLFLVTWALMMAAMMLPAMSPMVDAFIRVQDDRRAAGNRYVPTAVFIAGYLVLWAASGVLAFLPARWLEDAAIDQNWPMEETARFGGALIVAAGFYQLSSLKRMCLSKCRTPMAFIATSWREGGAGALRMGLEHGAYCLGCCWLLSVILFPLGIMNVAVMIAVTALVFAEKVLPHGMRVAAVSGVALVAYGMLVIAAPEALPTMM